MESPVKEDQQALQVLPVKEETMVDLEALVSLALMDQLVQLDLKEKEENEVLEDLQVLQD